MTGAFEALGFDPAPGELSRVDASAERYRLASERLGCARDAIASIVNQTGVWEGEASEAFARRVGDLPEHLDAATRSMSQAATALSDWHAELSELRRRAWDLELQARKADLDAVLASAERLMQQHDEAAHRIAALLDKARDLAPDDPGLFGRCLEAAGDAFTTAGLTFAAAHMGAARIVGDVIEGNAHVIANASDVLGDVSTLLAAAGGGRNVVPVLGQIGDQALNHVSRQFGLAALAGHAVARLAGGKEVVSDETFAIDIGGLVTASVPGSGVGSLVVQGGVEKAAGDDAATIYDNLGQYWKPRDLRQGLEYAVGPGGIAVALENAVADGTNEDGATQADRDRERAEERVWE